MHSSSMHASCYSKAMLIFNRTAFPFDNNVIGLSCLNFRHVNGKIASVEDPNISGLHMVYDLSCNLYHYES